MIEVVAALIENSEGKLLICRRPEGKTRAHLWEFVGGKVESGESGRDALIRECREELGIGIETGEEAADIRYDYPDVSIHLVLIRARISEGKPVLREHEDMKWIGPGEESDYSFCPADAEILRKIRQKAAE